MSTSQLSLAARAYLYGYPLVHNVREMIRVASGPTTIFSAPVNVFGHATGLAGPETEFVSPNNDTLYSVVMADVTKEPLVLHLPDADDRYYVMQFIDAWTNNFAYLGRRATGTKEGSYLLASTNWEGEIPDGVTILRSPTNVFAVVGRFATTGGNDLAAVRTLQEDTWVKPLSLYPDKTNDSERQFGDWELAPENKGVKEELLFWEQLRAWMKLFPPPDIEQTTNEEFQSLGLLADKSPYEDPDPTLVETLKAGEAETTAFIEANMASGESINGWSFNAHAFDFNLDRLEIGTLDTPEWKFPDRATAYFFRSVLARIGLWGQHSYEAAYPQVFVDEHGEQLTGTRQYALHFDELPPVDAFWSITMYNIPKFHLVDNSINRYSIGDRTPGLRYNQDGSLDIHILCESPGPGKESNWLPTPEGDFRLILRMYQPRSEALSGAYVFPPIRRVD